MNLKLSIECVSVLKWCPIESAVLRVLILRQVVLHSCVNSVTTFSCVYWSGTLCARNTVDPFTRIACDFPSHLVRRTIKSMKWIIFGHIWTHRTILRIFEASGGLTVELSAVFRVDTYVCNVTRPSVGCQRWFFKDDLHLFGTMEDRETSSNYLSYVRWMFFEYVTTRGTRFDFFCLDLFLYLRSSSRSKFSTLCSCFLTSHPLCPRRIRYPVSFSAWFW